MTWRRVRSSWVARASEMMRWTRVLAYAALTLSGAAAILWPPVSIRAATDGGNLIPLVWAALMGVSAAFCAFGAAADRWAGEYIGLFPLATTAAIFALSALSRGESSRAGALFLFGFALWILTRWQEVALLRVEADRKAQERSGGSPG